MSNGVAFGPKDRFPRPCAVLHSPGRLKTGERFYILDYLPAEHDGGGQCGFWDGTDYDEGLAAALDFEKEGTRVFYVDGEANL